MKKIVILSLLAMTMLVNAGCTDDEVAAGAIGVIIGIGLGDGGHTDYHRPAPYRPRRPGCYAAETKLDLPIAINANEVAVTEDSVEDARIADFAFKYNISLDAAAKVDSAFSGISTEGVSSFAKIGLNKKDVESLMKHSLPSSDSIKSMSEKLDMSEAQARDFLLALNREFQVQAADVTSPYWKSCMAKGKWRTPENNYCKMTSWSGCSPETGATVCF